MIKAVFFDLWNTLAYLEGLPETQERVKAYLGDRYQAYREAFVAWHDDNRTEQQFFTDLQAQGAFTAEDIQFLQEAHNSTHQLYPETKEVLEQLKEQGYKVGLISNSPSTSQKRLEELGIADYFDVVIWSFDIGLRKPRPEIFEKALEEIHLPAEQVMFVGDSEDADAKGSEAVGMFAVQVKREGEAGFHRKVKDLKQLFQFLK